MEIWIVIGILVLLLVVWPVSTYNRFVRLRNAIAQAGGSIDAVLKQRFDLLPNLAETVKRYAAHESSVLTQVTAMRGGKQSYDELSAAEKNEFANRSLLGIRDFYAVAEQYPELKASDHFMHLQRTLNEQEEQISAARRTYNAMVTEYNNAIQSFPASVIAGLSRFYPEQVLEISEEERAVPNLSDLFGNNN